MSKQEEVYIEIDVCLICHDNDGDLCSNICKCKTNRYHKKCLFEWINTKKSLSCEICNEEYTEEIISDFFLYSIQTEESEYQPNEKPGILVAFLLCSAALILLYCLSM
jgi:hypothetical protein